MHIIIILEVIGMYFYESRVGKKHQTVVPMQVRKAAGISEGDYLIWEVDDKGCIVVKPQKNKTDQLASLSKKVFDSSEEAMLLLDKERDSWK